MSLSNKIVTLHDLKEWVVYNADVINVEDVKEALKELIKVFEKKINLEQDGAGNFTQRVGMIFWILEDALKEIFGEDLLEEKE